MRRLTRRGMAALCGVVAFTAIGCGEDDDGGTAGAAKESTNYEIAFVNSNTADPYFVTMACGVRAEAKRLGATVQVQGPATASPDASKQLALLDAVIARNPDAILFDSPDPKAFTAPLKQAVRGGIKVLFVNQAPADRSMGSGFVLTDDKKGGMLAGEHMIRVTGGSGPVMSMGFNTFPALKVRQDGFTEAIKQASGLDYVGNFFDPSASVAKDVGLVSAQLQKHPDMAGVYGLYDAAAVAAIQAIRSSGKTGEIKVVAFDATPALIKALNNGSMDGIILQKPEEIGSTATKQVIDVLDGGSVPETTLIEPTLVTKENLAENERFLYKENC